MDDCPSLAARLPLPLYEPPQSTHNDDLFDADPSVAVSYAERIFYENPDVFYTPQPTHSWQSNRCTKRRGSQSPGQIEIEKTCATPHAVERSHETDLMTLASAVW